MNTTTIIAIANLHPFEGHPYQVRDDAEMEALVESIREYGILTPLIVRPTEDTPNEYEVISGHRRLHAAQKAEIVEVPAFVHAISREEAAIQLVDSNLHRERLLPSEKAFAYKLKMDALKQQGRRTDLTSSQVATKFDAAAEIGSAAKANTARQVASLTRDTSRGKRSSMPQPKTRPDSPVTSVQGPCDRSLIQP